MTTGGQPRGWRNVGIGGDIGTRFGSVDDEPPRVGRRRSAIAQASSIEAPEAAFATMADAGRVWAVGAIFADHQRLVALHRALWPRLKRNDHLVYLGNTIGRGAAVTASSAGSGSARPCRPRSCPATGKIRRTALPAGMPACAASTA